MAEGGGGGGGGEGTKLWPVIEVNCAEEKRWVDLFRGHVAGFPYKDDILPPIHHSRTRQAFLLQILATRESLTVKFVLSIKPRKFLEENMPLGDAYNFFIAALWLNSATGLEIYVG